jgi:CUB/sushi domain-containing protein
LYENLHAFTVAFWMKTRDEENAGTPVSYAVKLDKYVQENGLVLKDYGNLAIQINNQTGYTADRLNDGRWHHVAVTWQSSNGIWVYYRDGKEVKRATEPVAKGKILTCIGPKSCLHYKAALA